MDTNNCLASFQFIGNSIKNLQIQNDFVFLSEQDWNDSTTEIDVKYSIEDIDAEDDKLIGVINLYLALNITHEDRKLNVDFIIQGGFSSESQSEEEFKEQLAVNGCTALYSISRSVLAATLSQCFSGCHIMLPMINVFELTESK